MSQNLLSPGHAFLISFPQFPFSALLGAVSLVIKDYMKRETKRIGDGPAGNGHRVPFVSISFQFLCLF